MRKETKGHYAFIVTNILLTLFLALIAYVLLRYVRMRLDQDVKVNLLEITRQNSRVIDEQAALDFSRLDMLGSYVYDQFGGMEDPGIPAFLKEQADRLGFYQLIVSNPSGKAYSSVNNERLDISKRLYFKTAMAGNPHFSDKIVSLIDGKDIYIASVPILRDNRIVGTMHKVYTAETFGNVFDISLFNNRGYINIINDAGDVMVHAAEDGVNLINNNYYRELYLRDNAAQAELIKSELAAGKSGFVEISIDKKSHFAAYMNIERAHGWSIIAVVPSEVISHNSTLVTMLVLLLLAVLTVICVLSFTIFYTQSQRSKRALEVMAFVDSLTGGNNFNRYLIEGPALLLRNHETKYAVLKMDIDNFKFINDLHGFDFGDTILRSVYMSLSGAMTENELFARGSGDNFYSLIEYIDLETTERRISDAITPVFDNYSIFFSISCGVCPVGDPSENPSEKLQQLIDKAGIASKYIKGNTKRFTALFNEKMLGALKEEEEIKQTMERALRNGEFEAFFQPKVNVYESKIRGAEVLVRWRSPEKGLIPPIKFIPTFEKTGFIVDVDLCMFECVCKKLRGYIDSGIEPIPISVNFSRVHLYNRQFIANIKDLAKQYEIPSGLIDIELTESAIFENLDTIKDITLELQSFGFTVSMDDFGSGYSSLNMLKEIPINVLKIDKDFFVGNSSNERRNIVIRHIVELAHSLDIKVVAEGVETAEQVEFLQQINCAIAQGYYYSKPLPSNEFDELYKRGVL